MAGLFNKALTCLALLTTLTTAYRPVQFVKHTGDNGRADQAFSLTQYYNTTTSQSDLYVRMEAYRYKSTARGWTALALGPMMAGGLMFITYGDPTSSDSALTLSVRTASGHHPPEVLSSMTDFYSGPAPEVEIQRATFEPYTGDYYSTIMNLAPSHLGMAEFIVRGYDKWTGAEIKNDTTSQMFIWSSNFKQDFEGDFSVERHIDMHQFGLGFGWVRVDLANAAVPAPMFGAIDDTLGHMGVNEIAEPAAPTKEELEAGDKYVAAHETPSSSDPEPTTAITSPTPTDIPSSTIQPTTTLEATAAADTSTPTPTLNPNPSTEQPVSTPKQFSIRSVMWHLHGLLMVAGFLFLYPLGIYLIRCPRPDAFNLHWTVMALGSVSVVLGAIIGYINSHSISITHQYIGIALVWCLAGQAVLGWRHHMHYLATKTKNYLSTTHIYLGRVLVPLGFVNIITGLQLRQYGWFTIFLVVALMICEACGLGYYLFMAARRNVRMDQGVGASAMAGGKGVMTGEDAEEYFQLTGEDDEFSDSDDGEGAAGAGRDGKTKAERKREESERLRRLDKV